MSGGSGGPSGLGEVGEGGVVQCVSEGPERSPGQQVSSMGVSDKSHGQVWSRQQVVSLSNLVGRICGSCGSSGKMGQTGRGVKWATGLVGQMGQEAQVIHEVQVDSMGQVGQEFQVES